MTVSPRVWLAHLLLGTGLLASGCSLLRSAVNDSPGLRWWLFSNFGAQKVCPKVLASGAPLRLVPTGPIIGRFFPNRCVQSVDDTRQTLTLQLGGTGFAWTPLAGRVGYAADAVVEYRMDFRMTDDDALYVWAVPTGGGTAPSFRLGAVENPVVNWAAHGPAGYLASTFGSQILTSHLGQGFTVIRDDSGDEFALGRIEPPARPPKPFALSGDDRIGLANETSELHTGQIDVAGPLVVADDEQALYFRFRVTGPSVDALLYPQSVIDPWREGLQTGAVLQAPPATPIKTWVLVGGAEQSDQVPLPPGPYVLIFDHSNRIGQVQPPFALLGALGAASSQVSYAVELGEAED